MHSTPTTPTSSSSSSPFFANDMPPIPEQIIVTFEGKTREVVRIVRDEEERRPRTSSGAKTRPRFYARQERLERPEID
jgi:hypothetical protein